MSDHTFGEDSIINLLVFKYHYLVLFATIVFAIIYLVNNLIEKGHFQYQIKSWVKSIVLGILLLHSASSFVYAVYFGHFWFAFPVVSVVLNDIGAYFFGVFFGKTPLIKLSPKKTVEGFIGGVFSSFMICFIMSSYMSGIKHLVCPQQELTFEIFQKMNCQIDPLYIHQDTSFDLGPFGKFSMNIAPIQLHSLSISLFTSLIAPFGGFMASGFKRAYKIKDFADKIPGHGGITDRFDCKIVVGWFLGFYLQYVVYKDQANIEKAYSNYQIMEDQDKIQITQLLQSMILNSNQTNTF
ncbi:phosphatidate cytidylyltransferase [Stylonychia lemnae]|uniref:Phosphatidate cytidylyltransferase n=1 Tax=Stylonychia lemnae TaxID=5949 RepID=A0A078B9X8_STYLE|nr:phosphatidate cytidylyltransferase [Stylonychia lemnae]|eukprot:CDW91016.1 phosphatidate cytidylyltransferase [Stylonychia lemnae]